MTNLVRDAAMDALLDNIGNAATTMHVCSGDPADRAAVIANSLGNVAVNSAQMTKANGDVSGRKGTWAQQSIAAASASGTAAVVCIIDATVLLLKADLANTQAITSGNPITVNAFDHEVRDP